MSIVVLLLGRIVIHKSTAMRCHSGKETYIHETVAVIKQLK